MDESRCCWLFAEKGRKERWRRSFATVCRKMEGKRRLWIVKNYRESVFRRLEISSENNQLHSGQRKIRLDVRNAHDAHRQLFPLSYAKFTIRYYRTPVAVGKACTIYPPTARRKFIEFIGPRKFIDPDKSLSAIWCKCGYQ